jgi:hypothetical protein
MTLPRIFAALLVSASIWCAALVVFQATLTGARWEIWVFSPFVLAGAVAALFVAQWAFGVSRKRIS